jgi:oligoendopeptidase F
MGKAYLADLDRCLTSRWIDGLPCQNKRSGGYTSGSHDTAPFMLMNYLPGVDGLYTKTHEIGHMINALRSRAKQPPHLSGNPTNVAEVASTLDEHLLSDYLLRNTTDEKMRFFILCRIADGFKNTFFTQLMYHEFELAAHALVEAGGGVTREALDAIYLEKLHKYFGGAVHVDTFMGSGWSRIPHFYNAFYVWNYASSWVASTLLAQAIKHEGQPAVDRVINMLSIGSSKYPLEILHDAGIDMTNEATIQKALDYFAEVVAELEEIAVRLNFNG